MNSPLIFNIQRFSLHDGDGIRTTVFFKGCPLRCAWCHNPESRRYESEIMYFKDRCISCGRCRVSELKADTCPTGAKELVGRFYSQDELLRIALRDRQCYDVSGGGVTFSGGEVLAQDMDYVSEAAKRLFDNGISLYIDTCGYVPWANIERILPFTDVFLYDIKAMAPELHRRYIGVDNQLILDNYSRLCQAGAAVYIRIPVVPGVNDTDEEQNAMIAFAKRHAMPRRVYLLPYHKLGSDKAARLDGQAITEFNPPEASFMEALADKWRDSGFNDVRIGG